MCTYFKGILRLFLGEDKHEIVDVGREFRSHKIRRKPGFGAQESCYNKSLPATGGNEARPTQFEDCGEFRGDFVSKRKKK